MVGPRPDRAIRSDLLKLGFVLVSRATPLLTQVGTKKRLVR
jgi:hypothetical protein